MYLFHEARQSEEPFLVPKLRVRVSSTFLGHSPSLMLLFLSLSHIRPYVHTHKPLTSNGFWVLYAILGEESRAWRWLFIFIFQEGETTCHEKRYLGNFCLLCTEEELWTRPCSSCRKWLLRTGIIAMQKHQRPLWDSEEAKWLLYMNHAKFLNILHLGEAGDQSWNVKFKTDLGREALLRPLLAFASSHLQR